MFQRKSSQVQNYTQFLSHVEDNFVLKKKIIRTNTFQKKSYNLQHKIGQHYLQFLLHVEDNLDQFRTEYGDFYEMYTFKSLYFISILGTSIST